jgi:hypothetical protein
MIDKLILPSSFNMGLDRNAVELMPMSSRGMDSEFFTKSASLFTNEISRVKSEPGTSVLHVIAMGADERYGPNKNADAFGRNMLKKSHHTFVTKGHVFKEHDNDDPKKASGSVLHSAYNDVMDRVELLIRVKNANWSEELNKLANDQDITVSMSCRVPYDVCAICGNKAPTRAQYCDDMKKHAGMMLDDGQVVHVKNPVGEFYDISGVRRQADRIAYGLRKVASYGPVETGADLFAKWASVGYDLRTRDVSWRKRGLLRKLAAMEKEIEVSLGQPQSQMYDLSGAFGGGENEGEGLDQLHECASHGGSDFSDVIRSLGDAKISLSLRDFARVVLGKREGLDPALDDAEHLLPSLFSQLADADDEECCDDSSYDLQTNKLTPVSNIISNIVSGLMPNMSLGSSPAKHRVVRIIAVGGPRTRIKSASVTDPLAVGLAREYAKYKLSFIDGVGADSTTAELSLLQNFFV